MTFIFDVSISYDFFSLDISNEVKLLAGSRQESLSN